MSQKYRKLAVGVPSIQAHNGQQFYEHIRNGHQIDGHSSQKTYGVTNFFDFYLLLKLIVYFILIQLKSFASERSAGHTRERA